MIFGRWTGYTVVISAFLFLQFGMFGFMETYPERYLNLSDLHFWLNTLYDSIQLFFFESSIDPGTSPSLFLNLARFGAPLLLTVTAIQTFMIILKEKIHDWRLSVTRGHTVICGLGKKGYELTCQLINEGKTVVIIEIDESNNFITPCREMGAFLVNGDAAAPSVLKKAEAAHAYQIYMVTGNDGMNFSALVELAEIKRNETRPRKDLKAWVHLNAVSMCSFLRNETLMQKTRNVLDFEIISLFEIAARDLVLNKLLPLFPCEVDSKGRIHLIQVGLGRMGRTIIRSLTESAVTANGAKPLITPVSLNTKDNLEKFMNVIPAVRELCDFDPTPLSGDIQNENSCTLLLDKVKKSLSENNVPVICLALDQEYTNLTSALLLAELFNEHKLNEIPIFVRLTESEGWSALAEDISKQNKGAFHQIHGFGAITDIAGKEKFTQSDRDRMAQTLHKIYRMIYGVEKAPSHQQWDQLPWHYKNSSRAAADHIRVKLRTIGLDMTKSSSAKPVKFRPAPDQLTMLAQLEHRRYCVERRINKWKPGEKTDYQQMIHECLVGWEKLSKEEKQKDFDQLTAIPTILKEAGFNIVKLEKH